MDKKKIGDRILTILFVVAILVARGSIIHTSYEKHLCNQMLKAVETNDMQRLKIALFFGDPNSSLGIPLLDYIGEQSDRDTPLKLACKKGNFEMVKVLVENGADVNYTSWRAFMPALYHAVQSDTPDNLEIVRYLIKNGADVNPSPSPSNGPLYALLATTPFPQNGMGILRELVNAGAKLDYCLDEASYWRHNEAILYLVEECGCDISGVDYIGLYCRGANDFSRETFELMLKHGADPYARDEYGKCAIDYLKEEPAPEWAETVAEMAKEYGFEG